MSDPIAYFLTFSTYGTWLHGKNPQSVYRANNRVGMPFVPPNAMWEKAMSRRMRQPAYELDRSRREIVLSSILEVCRFRGWKLWAAHVRTNHVHVVITARQLPERVMTDLKAYASRRLRESTGESADRDRWTQHGSTRWINDEEGLIHAIEYVLNGQGEPISRFPDPSESNIQPQPNEPEA